MSEVKVCPTCGSEYPVSERFCPRDGSALKSQNPEGDLVGTVIAERYHVIRKLGEGGMGTVYLAEHVKMGRKSALKVMNPGMSQDADAIARFNREASNASRMNHPNICAIYDFGETTDGVIYLAMEFIEGEPLTDIIERMGALPPARAAAILHQTADALQVAHDYGIVHRDLKPDNIMIAKGRDGADVVKVVDFGIAKAHTSDAQKVTKTGLVVGTPEYMSPEQLAGDKLDGRSDIYSLGLVGFNMLTGALPFPSNSAQEAMIMRLTDEPKTLAEMRPDVAWPPGLQAVLTKALAREVGLRYQKASDFGREFSMAVEAMPVTAMAEAGTLVIGAQRVSPEGATAAIPRTRVASDAEQARISRGEPAATPVARRSVTTIVAGVAVVVAALGFGVWKVGFAGRGDLPSGPGVAQADPNAGGGGNGAGGAGGRTGDASGINGATGPTARPQAPPTVPPNSQRGGQTAATGGTTADPARGAGGAGATATVSAAELEDLRIRVDAIDADNPNRAVVTQIVALASTLLARAEGEVRGEVLMRRGIARLALGQNETGCKDLTDALELFKSPDSGTFVRMIRNAYFDPAFSPNCAQ